MEYNHFNKRKGELFQILEKLKCTQKSLSHIKQIPLLYVPLTWMHIIIHKH